MKIKNIAAGAALLLATCHLSLVTARAQAPSAPRIVVSAVNGDIYADQMPGTTTADKVQYAINTNFPPAVIILVPSMSGNSCDFSGITTSLTGYTFIDERQGAYGLAFKASTGTSINCVSQTSASTEAQWCNAATQTGADAGAKIAACAAQIQAAGGGIIDATRLTGAQTITQNTMAGVTVPGVINFNPFATFSTSVAQAWPSYWIVNGGVAGFPVGGGVQAGTIFKWTGAANGNIFTVFNAHNVQIRNINFDHNSVSGVTSILYDGTNSPAGHNCRFENLSSKNIVAGYGMRWGTSAVNDYQLDTSQIDGWQIYGDGTTEGIVINSGNAADASQIKHVTCQIVNRCIDDQESGFVRLSEDICGTLAGTTPICFNYVGANGITIENSQSEGAGTSKFLDVSGAPSYADVIYLYRNTANDPVTISRNATVISEGNYFTSTATLAAGSPRLVSIADRFSPLSASWTTTVGQMIEVAGIDAPAGTADIRFTIRPGVPFANLGTSVNGTLQFCNNCNSTCTAGGGTGQICEYVNGAWTH